MPHATAVCDGEAHLTYGELDLRSNRLARLLTALGIGREVVAALLFDRSIDFVVAALAVWKAGGAYLPLDSHTAPLRAAAILEDSAARLLISHRGKADAMPKGAWRIVDLDADSGAIESRPSPPAPAVASADQLAYVIYTSGSTGKPKGVEIAHGNLLNLVEWHLEAFHVTSEDRASQLSGLGFDAAVWEIWPCLAAGASLHIAPENARKSPPELRDWIVSERVTIGFVPTAVAEYLLDLEWPPASALRIALTGADTLHRRPGPRTPFLLVNNYGPTECTVVSTSGVVAASTGGAALRPSIGTPIRNGRVHILDDQMREVLPGEAGELCIAGPGVGRGYRNLPQATREKFVADPFDPNGKLYRSGDRARLLPDGEIEFLGRTDDQVKIRGFRIELDEIAWALNQHPGVTSSAVVARAGASEPVLTAYLVLAGETSPSAADLRDFLLARLPEYMVPLSFVKMDSLPVNANGKVDRPALPEPGATNVLPNQVTETAPAADSFECELAALIANQLGVPSVGRADNFFLMGGHSMFAARLTAKLRETFGVSLPMRQLFQAPTVAKLAAEVERLRGQRG